MKKSNKLKYDILASYSPRENETYHSLISTDNNETFQTPNIIVDYGVKFHKAFPKYEIPSYSELYYDRKRNKIYVMMVSKGNPYGLVANNKDVKINLNNIKENLK